MYVVLGIAVIIFLMSFILFWNQTRIERQSRSSILVIKENNNIQTIPVHETTYTIKRPWGGHGLLANPFKK